MRFRILILSFYFNLFFCGGFHVSAQSFIAKANTVIGPNINGFYEYLPQGYDASGTQQYSLLIASHGVGERGNGSAIELQKLIQPNKGLASLLASGSFPTSFSVNGQSYKFIILCPQYTDNGNTWPVTQNIEDIINYAQANYKVDVNRIYLTGLSMGGGLSFRYVTESSANASKIAAFVPICAALQPGPPYAAKPDSLATRNITVANLPVWATHNDADPVVPVSFTDSMIHYINASPPPSPIAKKTIFNNPDHDAWTQTYDPAFTDAGGLNIYQWMLQFQRSFAVLPVTIIDYNAYLSSTNQVTITWKVTSQFNHGHFTLERSVDGILFTKLSDFYSTSTLFTFKDEHPIIGNNYYRLSQTDLDGKKKYFGILKVGVDAGKINNMAIHPNPVKNFVTVLIENKEMGSITVSMIDLLGNVVKTWNFHKSTFTWNKVLAIQGNSQGSYLFQITGKNFMMTKMIVLQ